MHTTEAIRTCDIGKEDRKKKNVCILSRVWRICIGIMQIICIRATYNNIFVVYYTAYNIERGGIIEFRIGSRLNPSYAYNL